MNGSFTVSVATLLVTEPATFEKMMMRSALLETAKLLMVRLVVVPPTAVTLKAAVCWPRLVIERGCPVISGAALESTMIAPEGVVKLVAPVLGAHTAGKLLGKRLLRVA